MYSPYTKTENLATGLVKIRRQSTCWQS